MRRDKTTASEKQYILGLDGGGTKTHAVLFDVNDKEFANPLKTTLAGPSNLNSTGKDRVRAHFQAILRDLDVQVSSIVATGLGAAGISGPRVYETLHEILSSLGLQNLCIVGDQAAALRGALDHEPGILLIAGTGSIAMGQGPRGLARAGGFGHLIGDEGSGYSIGKAFLSETLKVFDGQREHSRMTKAVHEFLDTEDPIAEIMGLFYQAPFDKSRIARFAVVMDPLLDEGDAETLAIAKHEAGVLLRLVETVAKKISGKDLNLVLAGSLLKSKPYRQVFMDLLTESRANYTLTEAKSDAASGAASLARDLLETVS